MPCSLVGIVLLKYDGTRTETRFNLSPKRTSPFKSAGASVQSTAGSRGWHISGGNAGYTMFRSSVIVLATHSICQFPLRFPSRASPCAIRFQTHSTSILQEPTAFIFWVMTEVASSYETLLSTRPYSITVQKIRTNY